jgi:hypothetical protein
MSIDTLKDRLPDYARDLKLNLSSLTTHRRRKPSSTRSRANSRRKR